jgi:NitT/TauT family transport system permease protein
MSSTTKSSRKSPAIPLPEGLGAPGGTALPVLVRRLATYGGLAAGTVLLWQFVASLSKPIFFPPPGMVLQSFVEMVADRSLFEYVAVSYWRIMAGWLVGSLIGIPVGLLVGRVPFVRTLLDPYIQFFRFIPPIAFVTLSLIWFGLGETSKIALIVYTTTFIVILNTLAGVLAVSREKIRAGLCLGASGRQILLHIVIPSTVPYIITGMRLAMGNSFMTVVSAEMIAAQSGIGYLIFNSRLFMQTDRIFVGIITLGVMGLLADFLLRFVARRLAYRYSVKL